jgi:pimeloyl-ACP methyl ester carboxylesterase
VVVAKFKDMVSTQPAITVEQLGRITAPTLVGAGDDDMVTLDHTSTLFRAIPNSELAVGWALLIRWAMVASGTR